MAGPWRLRRCGWRTAVAAALLTFLGANVAMFFLATLSNVLDPDPPLAPGEVAGLPFHVGTYNIWNYNNYWDVRKLRIAEVIRGSDLDIVGLQEVRNVPDLGGNQLDHLKQLLPEYPHAVFHSAHIAKRQGRLRMRVPDPEEGVAILSKHPIVHTEIFELTTSSGAEDQNVRVVILAHVDVPKLGLVYFFVTHLSFVPTIQCRHVYELLRIIRSLDLDPTRPKIVVGDFNIFPDYEDPAAFFDQDPSEVGRDNRCWDVLRDEGLEWDSVPMRGSAGHLSDVWSILRPGDDGFTFSNLQWAEATHTFPARPTRPDRIFLSGFGSGQHRLLPRRVVRREDGSQYLRLYYWQLMAHRTRHLIRTLIDPRSNPNPHFSYVGIYSSFYEPLLSYQRPPAATAKTKKGTSPTAGEKPQPPDANLEVDSQGRVTRKVVSPEDNQRKKATAKTKKGTSPTAGEKPQPPNANLEVDSRKEAGGEEEGSSVGSLYRRLSIWLIGFPVHEIFSKLPSLLPFFAFAVAPSFLIYALMMMCYLCSFRCGCSRCCPPRPPVTSTRRCRRLVVCPFLVFAGLVAVAVVPCVAVFLAPVFFTDYVDDLVPSDHRLLVASFFL